MVVIIKALKGGAQYTTQDCRSMPPTATINHVTIISWEVEAEGALTHQRKLLGVLVVVGVGGIKPFVQEHRTRRTKGLADGITPRVPCERGLNGGDESRALRG